MYGTLEYIDSIAQCIYLLGGLFMLYWQHMLKHLHARTPFIIGVTFVLFGIFACEQSGIYYILPGFDKLLHVIGGVIAAWFTLAIFQNEITHMRSWKQALIIISVTLFIGVAWECAEYISNFAREIFPLFYRYFHGGDLADTLGDLLADTIGAGILTLWALRKEQSR